MGWFLHDCVQRTFPALVSHGRGKEERGEEAAASSSLVRNCLGVQPSPVGWGMSRRPLPPFSPGSLAPKSALESQNPSSSCASCPFGAGAARGSQAGDLGRESLGADPCVGTGGERGPRGRSSQGWPGEAGGRTGARRWGCRAWDAGGISLSSLQSVAALQPGACCFWEVRGRWAGVKASV